MATLLKFIIYIEIFSSKLNYVWTKPVSNKGEHIYDLNGEQELIHIQYEPREQRQVVQPTWLTDMDNVNIFEDKSVQVNPENLQEAAEIRHAIQEAVRSGLFAVQFNETPLPITEPAAVIVETGLPVAPPSNPEEIYVPPDVWNQQNWWAEWQRGWTDFWQQMWPNA